MYMRKETIKRITLRKVTLNKKNQVRGGKLLLLIDYHSQYMMFLLIRFMHESSADNN